MRSASLGDLEVSRIGLGIMGMSAFYTGAGRSEAEFIRTIHHALDLGITHLDTAEVYGPFTNEELLGRALEGRRDQAVVATKFGSISYTGRENLDSSPANVRLAVKGSLRRLRTDHLDLYYQHRVDPGTPVEETVGALAEVEVRHIRLSRRPGLPRSAARTPSTRSGLSRASTRSGPATVTPGCCRCCASWGPA